MLVFTVMVYSVCLFRIEPTVCGLPTVTWKVFAPSGRVTFSE